MLSAEASQGPPFFVSVKISIKSAANIENETNVLPSLLFSVFSFTIILVTSGWLYLPLLFFTPSHILSLPLLPYLVCVCVCVYCCMLNAFSLSWEVLVACEGMWIQCCGFGLTNLDPGFLVNTDPDPDTGFWRTKIEKSTGGKQILLFITKRQNRYLPLVLLLEGLLSPRNPMGLQVEHPALQNGIFFLSIGNHYYLPRSVFRIRIRIVKY